MTNTILIQRKVDVKFWEKEQVLGQIIAVSLRFSKEQENFLNFPDCFIFPDTHFIL